MGRSRRPTPKRLSAKLLAVRVGLCLTPTRMVKLLDYHETPLYPGHVREYEQGLREPPLPVLLRYARVAKVSMEVLVDDRKDFRNRDMQFALNVVEADRAGTLPAGLEELRPPPRKKRTPKS